MGAKERRDHILQAIAEAAARAGRRPEDITLVAVSKTFPQADILDLASLGQVDFGENKVQEFVEKRDALAGSALRWHLIGHLQRNKVKDVVHGVHLFHALDSVRLGAEFQKRLTDADAFMTCLVQVNVSGEASKFGVDPSDVRALMDALAAFDRLQLAGFMTLAAPVDDPEDVRPQFARLRELAERHRDSLHTDEPMLSMGMSGDFRVAIEEGATHVRIGSALFGSRD